MKNSELAYKKQPVKMINIFIYEYFPVKYKKIKRDLNCFLSLRKLTYENNNKIYKFKQNLQFYAKNII